MCFKIICMVRCVCVDETRLVVCCLPQLKVGDKYMELIILVFPHLQIFEIFHSKKFLKRRCWWDLEQTLGNILSLDSVPDELRDLEQITWSLCRSRHNIYKLPSMLQAIEYIFFMTPDDNKLGSLLQGSLQETGFPGGPSGNEPACQCRRHKRQGFDRWIRKIPWRRAWQVTPVFFFFHL